jgi:predicted lipid-binding transport protein (Tim44 family)
MCSARRINVLLIILFLFATSEVLAQDLFVFPNRGQSNEQMQRDRMECHAWARQQTGFDPFQASPGAPMPQATGGSTLGGMAGGGAVGAAGGAVIGGITGGNFGRGAAIGAASGALLGGMARSSQNRSDADATRQWAQQEAATQAAARDRFSRAYRTCLEGKGYTVN